MLSLITTFAFAQALIGLYVLPKQTIFNRHYLYLKTLIVLISIHLGIKLFLLSVLKDPYLFGRLNSFTTFSYGPLLYFQYRQFKGQKMSRMHKGLHLIPFLLAFLLYVSCLIGQLPSQNPALFHQVFEVFVYLLMLSVASYTAYLLWKLIPDTHLPSHERSLLLQCSAFFMISVFMGYITSFLNSWLGTQWDAHFFPYLAFGFICWICLRFFLRQHTATQIGFKSVASVRETYEKSGLSEMQLQAYFEALEQFMRREKPFRNPELSLDDLSQALKISRHQLSQVLNQKAEKNFYAYVNDYRVQEMIVLLKKHPGEKIAELAHQVGFQSKTTLNTYFKKVTGYSPTQYQQFLSNPVQEAS
ncbi:helix-turn-helix domain-containing protein [Siphonobacter sp. SORGH_AS_0500]|uniref:helix-turn-helix domain-containing protein n=1 Tax=Siphonobacter sp. SORGH_AS_0500 TaxID=1864824 RepID=UPI00286537E4|nr:helix-turn-helix domain-containing protein [Siphonobacter sp. SORGH_AS_0500]MDR6195801.1 AraC-like DNA-binding protein [Siphonobacter sp. SORGH_AS_0500]